MLWHRALTLYVKFLPLESATRLWDSYLLHGEVYCVRAALGEPLPPSDDPHLPFSTMRRGAGSVACCHTYARPSIYIGILKMTAKRLSRMEMDEILRFLQRPRDVRITAVAHSTHAFHATHAMPAPTASELLIATQYLLYFTMTLGLTLGLCDG